MINNVVLTGRLTKDVDLRYTQSGKSVANFTLAVNRKFKSQNSEQEADYISCVAWNKTADILANHTHKGSLIGVEGSIQTRNYENQQGQRVYVTEVFVSNITFLETKNGNNVQQNEQRQSQTQSQGFNTYADTSTDIRDDELPF